MQSFVDGAFTIPFFAATLGAREFKMRESSQFCYLLTIVDIGLT
jgi:hypothetical protein